MNNDISNQGKGSTTYVFLVCVVAALGGLLFGYDTGVINGAIGPLKAHFSLNATMEGWAAGCALVGCALGAAGVGALSDWLGRRKVMIIAAVLFFISAVGTAIPRTIWAFIFYRWLGGLGVGAASMTCPMYIAEITPARIRGRMVSVNQFAIVTGFLVVYFVNYFIALQGDEGWNKLYGWRWMFGSESLPAALLFILLFLVPESPRWLTKQNRGDEALKILTRVDGADYARAELAEIKEAIGRETGSIAQLFQPGMKIVLVIGIVLAVLQQVTGINVFLYFGTEIFKKMGSGTSAALLQTVVVGAVNMGFTVVAIRTVDRLGRKPLMMIGSAGMGISLLAMGLAAFLGRTDLWMLLFILGYIACFALSVGPVTWVILSEIFPTGIRGRAMGIATFCLWVANYIISQTFPMMDESKWLIAKCHHAFPFWLYGVFCVVLLIFVVRFVPETKGKSLEEIERYWLNRSEWEESKRPHVPRRQDDLPVRWLNFYIYGRIPLGIIGLLFNFAICLPILAEEPRALVFGGLLGALGVAFYILLFIGLHQRREWGWRLNWAALVLEVALSPLVRAEDVITYVVFETVIVLLWLVPNAIYFVKRRRLFS